jgi:hypothetical protein
MKLAIDCLMSFPWRGLSTEAIAGTCGSKVIGNSWPRTKRFGKPSSGITDGLITMSMTDDVVTESNLEEIYEACIKFVYRTARSTG